MTFKKIAKDFRKLTADFEVAAVHLATVSNTPLSNQLRNLTDRINFIIGLSLEWYECVRVKDPLSYHTHIRNAKNEWAAVVSNLVIEFRESFLIHIRTTYLVQIHQAALQVRWLCANTHMRWLQWLKEQPQKRKDAKTAEDLSRLIKDEISLVDNTLDHHILSSWNVKSLWKEIRMYWGRKQGLPPCLFNVDVHSAA